MWGEVCGGLSFQKEDEGDSRSSVMALLQYGILRRLHLVIYDGSSQVQGANVFS